MDERLLLVLLVQLAGSLLPTSAQDLDSCWETKGCFKQPQNCTGKDCKAFVTWEPVDGNLFKFTMRGKALGWVAFGLRKSGDSGMTPADVYACTKSPKIVRSENILSVNSEPRTIPSGSVTKALIEVNDDGTIACQFTRSASVSGDSTFYDIANNKFSILLAISDSANNDGSTENWASPETYQLSDVSVPNLDGCGVKKGCFQRNCKRDNCTAFVTWRYIEDGKFRFSMRTERLPNLAWVAFGLGVVAGTDRMSPADVYSCTKNEEIRRSFNVHPFPGHASYDSLERDILPGTVVNESVVFEDNVISCQFTRTEKTVGDAEFYDISGDNKYHIMLAIGDAINSNGTIQGHEHKHDWHTKQPLKLSVITTTPVPPVTTPIDLKGCGTTKGCFVQPSGCTGSDCKAFVTWQTLKNGNYKFALMGKANGYVAFGLRPGSTPTSTSGMIPADVYACTKNKDLKRSENEGNGSLNSNPRDIPVGSAIVNSASFENGVIMCEFERTSFIDGDNKFYNISQGNDYFILLAFGDTIKSDGTIQSNYHGSDRWSTSKATSLTTEIPEEDKSGIRLRKAHASLMVIAWIGFASIGITLARFFKPMWPDSKLFGTKIWFTIHRMSMVSCLVCFCVAFVLIFVAVGGFVSTISTTTVVHAIFGIIVTILGIINPIMAIFRPHPGTPNRPIFNWAHWGVGTAAHVIAQVTVYLGIGYQTSLLAGLNQYVFWVMVVFTGFHTLMWILFEVQQCMTESRGRRNDIPLQGGNSAENLADPDGPPAENEFQEGVGSQVTKEGSTAKTVLLGVYIVGVVVMVLFLIINFIIA